MSLTRRHTPSLFDKITAAHAGPAGDPKTALGQVYALTRDITSEAALKRAIGRDLGWLLNTLSYESLAPLDAYPSVQTSVLNYGVRDMSGQAINKATVARTLAQIRLAIAAFEPRLDKHSLVVEAADSGESRSTGVSIAIRADIAPSRLFTLYYTADLDLDSGSVSVRS